MPKNTLPAIVISRGDFDRLDEMLNTCDNPNAVNVLEYLERELDRATVVDDGALPAGVVAMYSKVTYSDDRSGKSRTVTLVYPHEANIEEARISVLTPIGAALIGMAAGKRIDWQARDGETQMLEVLAVAS